ncbi:Ig-like domain-containing protein [Streptomyces fractus]|uniref:Ig-like domain-containing protein n=1 Tax=Streptomyces fractus TaxID=641806 RepID=UPI003CF234A3
MTDTIWGNPPITGTVHVTVDPPEDTSAAADDIASTPYDTPVDVDVLANDTGLTTVKSVTDPAHGAATVSNGKVHYVPDTGFSGKDTFDYTATNNSGTKHTATVTIMVGTPSAKLVDDTASTNYETATDVDVLANDTGADTLANVSDPKHGTTTKTADNKVHYVPDDGFSGTDTFQYSTTASDTDYATVTMTVGAPDVSLVDDTASTAYQTATDVDVLANDTGADTLANVSDPKHGTTTKTADNKVHYVPDDGFSGTDTFQYSTTASDTDVATVTMTVDAPTVDAVNDTAAVASGDSVDIDVLANDVGDGLTLTSVGSGTAGGKTAISGNKVHYTAPDDSAGVIDAFTYTVTDSHGNTDKASVAVTVGAPSAELVDDTASTAYQTAADVDVLANDTGDLTLVGTTTPPHGTATVSNGKVHYVPDDGFSGTDTFTYFATAAGKQYNATVTMTVGAPDVKLVDDTASTAYQTATDVDVLANDTGADTLAKVSQPDHGTTTISDDKKTVNYKPDDGYSGTDTFTYSTTASDTDYATVTMTVDAPDVSLVDDTASTAYQTATDVDVLANDTGADTLANVSDPKHGTTTKTADNKVHYVPDDGFSGTDTFQYSTTASDTDVATVTMTVGAPPATVVDDTASTPFDTPADIDVLANDTGDLTVTSVTQPSHSGDDGRTHGTTTINSDGTVHYAPYYGFTGAEHFTYTATDTDGNEYTATVIVTVEGTDSTVVDDVASTPYETPVDVDVLANDTGKVLSTYSVTQPAHGTATINDDNTVHYVPDAGYSGPDTFTYRAMDGEHVYKTVGTVSMTVGDQPAGVLDDIASTNYETATDVDVLANDAGDLTLKSASDPDNGTAEVVDGKVHYVPDTGFSGKDTFTYTATDADNNEYTATVTVTVYDPSGFQNQQLVNDQGQALEATGSVQDGATGHGASVHAMDVDSSETAQRWTLDDGHLINEDPAAVDPDTGSHLVLDLNEGAASALIDSPQTADEDTDGSQSWNLNDGGSLTNGRADTDGYGLAATGSAATGASVQDYTGAYNQSWTATSGANDEFGTVTAGTGDKLTVHGATGIDSTTGEAGVSTRALPADGDTDQQWMLTDDGALISKRAVDPRTGQRTVLDLRGGGTESGTVVRAVAPPTDGTLKDSQTVTYSGGVAGELSFTTTGDDLGLTETANGGTQNATYTGTAVQTWMID